MIARAGFAFLLVGLLVWVTPSEGQTLSADTAVDPTNQRLGEALVRYSRFVLQTDPLPLDGWEAATNLLLEAVRIDKDRDSAWRMLVDIALTQDDTVLLDRAIRRLVKLDPADTTVRLTRLLVMLDQAATAPEQANLLEQLLDPDRAQALGPAVAGTLAMHLSTLERQMGNLGASRHWQDRAVALDASNFKAIAMNLGEDHADAVAWASHLVAMIKANPADMDTALRLGNHLLEHGDAPDAARFLGMSRDLSLAAGRDGGSSLDADYALALMLSGQHSAAETILEQRRKALDEMYQSIAESEAPEDRSAVDTARLQAPLTPKLAATALILAVAMQQDLNQPSVDLVEALKWNDLQQTQRNQSSGVRARPLRMGFRVALAVGASRIQLNEILQLLEATESDTAFELELLAAQDALADGRREEAEAALRAMRDRDGTARLRLADLLQANGDLRSAALEYAQLHLGGPGSFLGALSTLRLQALLGGRQLPLESTAAELEALAVGLAPVWTRYGSESTLAVSMRLQPQSRSVGLFDPLIVDIEIFNHLEVPLAITPTGPIKDLVVLEGDVQQPYSNVPLGRPFVVDVGRRLRLEPQGRLTIPIDLREYWIGSALDSAMLVGASLELEGVLNPRLATAPASGKGVPVPGPLGMIAASGILHVQGQRISADEVDAVLDRLLERDTDRELKDMALLAHLLVDTTGTELREPLEESQRQRVEAALSEKWPRLSPDQQAWLVSVMPLSRELGEYQELVDSSSESIVQQVLLMRLSVVISPDQALDDPRLIRGLRSTDPAVYSLAAFLEHFLTLSAEQRLQATQGEADQQAPAGN